MDQTGKKRNKSELACCRNLRLLWHRSPPFWEAMHRVKQGSNQYQCEGCKKVFKLREVQVDHIQPVIDPTDGWVSIQEFVWRLFCPAAGLQVLCQDVCHAEKTRKENKRR